MKQMTFANAEYAGKRKQTRKELFLIERDRMVPWKVLIALIAPCYPKGDDGRPSCSLMAMLRVYLMQNWFGYSDIIGYLGDRGLSLRQGTIGSRGL